MAYNKKVFGVFCVTNLVNENIFIYFLPRRILPQLDTPMREIFTEKINACKDYEEKLELSKEIFFTIAKEHPFIICSAWANAMLRTFLGLYSTQLKSMFNPSIQGGSCSFFNMQGAFLERIEKYITFGSKSPYLTLICLIEAWWLIMQYFLVILGFFALLCKKQYSLCFLFGSYISYFSFITGHDGCGRYRLMFEPILILLAAIGIAYLYGLLRQQKSTTTKLDHQVST